MIVSNHNKTIIGLDVIHTSAQDTIYSPTLERMKINIIIDLHGTSNPQRAV
jgi:hypothetical protein